MAIRKEDIDPYDMSVRDQVGDEIVRLILERDKNWQREVRKQVNCVWNDGIDRGIVQRRDQERAGRLTYGSFVATLETEVQRAFRVKDGLYNEAILQLIENMPSQEWLAIIRELADALWPAIRDSKIKEVMPEHLRLRSDLNGMEQAIIAELEKGKARNVKQLTSAIGLDVEVIENIGATNRTLDGLLERGLIVTVAGRGPTRWTIPV